MKYMRAPLAVRFARFVVPEPESECHRFVGANCGGVRAYGRIYSGGKYLLAHRVAYELAKGPIPEGLFVLHSCDNPWCVNPDHLHLGTQSQNLQEAYERGRLNMKRMTALSGEVYRNRRSLREA